MKILVIGDSCIDRFVYCDINRICPEAPVPVLNPIKVIENNGMAGNVVKNLESLGAKVDLVTNKETILKTRYIDDKSGQMIMRLDENDICKPIQSLASTGKAMPHHIMKTSDHDAIIVSDYCKGFLQTYDIQQITEMANCPIFLDTKKKLGDWCKGIDFIKINKPEWQLNPDYSETNVIVTDGKNGATYLDTIYPVDEEVNVSDVSGAGDTFMAGLVYKYIYGINVMKQRDISLAINFANKCASKVVQERGVTTI
jgi:D-beta-D-heptose 7-phosphate kinase/D-beta-D-heptose 1-phosphate adenosyltransferase